MRHLNERDIPHREHRERRNGKKGQMTVMRWISILFIIIVITGIAFADESEDVRQIRQLLSTEFEGHAKFNLGQILSCYVENCVGYFANGSPDPRRWSLSVVGIDSLRVLKEEALIETRDNMATFENLVMGDEVQHIDVKRDAAIAASRHYGSGINKETGERVRWDWINFWGLRKIRGQWKITSFISQAMMQ